MKHFLKQANKVVINWVTTYAVWILMGTIFLYIVLLISYRKYHWLSWVFDDSDKTNIIQIALFIGVIIVLYESIRIRELEYQPILSIFVKDWPNSSAAGGLNKYLIDIPSSTDEAGKVFCLAVRNVGNGTGNNLMIQLPEVKEKYTIDQEQTTIPKDNEVRFKIQGLELSYYKNLKLDVSSVSFITQKKFIYSFIIDDVSKRSIRYLNDSEEKINKINYERSRK